MGDEQQTIDTTGAAGASTPAPVSTGTVTPSTDWEARYKGLQRKMDEIMKENTKLQNDYNALHVDAEGLRSSSKNSQTEWETKSKTWEAEKGDLTKKLAQYDLTEKIRGLVHSDFKELAADFESDPFVRSGILSAAASMDDAQLKQSLTDAVARKKGQINSAIDNALSGSSTPAPTAPTGAQTEDQLNQQLKNERDPRKRDALLDKLAAMRDRLTQ